MKKSIITIYLISLVMGLNGQSFWLTPKKSADNEWCLTNTISQEQYFCDSVSTFQNFNPLVDLSEHEILLETQSNQGINIYTIYKTAKASPEQFIWSLSSKEKEKQILTDYRLANLDAGKFMNFVDFNPGEIHINNFLDHEHSSNKLDVQLGGEPKRKDLPILKNSAKLGEIIGLDKPLTPLAKQIFESSLALKYSITLSPSSDYLLFPNQSPIWNGDVDRDFHNNIAGIARNNALGLYQKQSKSSIEKGALIVALNKIHETNDENEYEFSENQSLIWGDNQGELSFYLSNEGIEVLSRSWLFKMLEFTDEDEFEIRLEEDIILDQIKETHNLWIKLSQDGKYKLYPANEQSQFSSVKLFDGSQNINFFQAPAHWLDVQITPSDCINDLLAKLQLNVMGIDSPFRLVVLNEAKDEIVYSNFHEEKQIIIDDLEAGKYSVKLIQDNEVKIEQEINITDSSVPTPKIPTNYVIDQSQSNIIDASYALSNAYEYEWLSPSQELVHGSIIELNEEGIYWLKIYSGDCHSSTRVHVHFLNDNIKSFSVYPNPSPNGFFHYDLELDRAFPTTIEICDISGRVIHNRSYSGSIYIEDHLQLYANGMYFMRVTSGSSTHTKKLVVQFP